MLINVFDNNGIKYSGVKWELKTYKNLEIISKSYDFEGITIFTDNFIFGDVPDKSKAKIKIAWLVEPKIISPNIYDIKKVQKKFDYIFTHDKNLLKLGDKYKFVPVGGCWIPAENIKINNKPKLISHILSNKFWTDNQKLRKTIYNNYKNKIDCFGLYCNQVETIDLALNDYMFSVCIENSSIDNYFTEKIINCFATGTIPIYCGCSNIEKFFNIEGIIQIKTFADFSSVFEKLNADYYKSKYKYVSENFGKSKEYFVIEDWIYENILKNI